MRVELFSFYVFFTPFYNNNKLSKLYSGVFSSFFSLSLYFCLICFSYIEIAGWFQHFTHIYFYIFLGKRALYCFELWNWKSNITATWTSFQSYQLGFDDEFNFFLYIAYYTIVSISAAAAAWDLFRLVRNNNDSINDFLVVVIWLD